MASKAHKVVEPAEPVGPAKTLAEARAQQAAENAAFAATNAALIAEVEARVDAEPKPSKRTEAEMARGSGKK